MMKKNRVLDKINSSKDVRKLSDEELNQLCGELRKEIIKVVSKNGGHLSSNLGVVELTVALHKIFCFPDDKLIWDVGHQSYTHKLLTGRKEQFSTLRQEGGLSGFCRPNESEYDCFISGHASTSLSAACGIARAELLKGSNNMVIAVIGDGSMTGGMAFEALNNASELKNLVIILNYNEMSISKNVGGLARYLSNMRSTHTYLQTKKYLENMLDMTPVLGKPLKQGLYLSKLRIKDFVYHSNLFTELGFSYLGNVDGHNLANLQDAFHWAKKAERPALIQVFTTKGKGYSKAENNPGEYHSVSSFSVKEGTKPNASRENFSIIFGKELAYLAGMDRRICAITAAMKYGTGLQFFAAAYGDRFFDVGIAEEHAVTFAAGLASNGMLPVFAVYSTFLQRGFDQIIHDAAISKEHIVLAIDRAGIVGEDGETHQGIFDVSYLSLIPGIVIYSPANYQELRKALKRALYKHDGIVAVRYPRGEQNIVSATYKYSDQDYSVFGDGKIALVTYGRIVSEGIRAQEDLNQMGINTSLFNLNRIYPIPEKAVQRLEHYSSIFFFEEGIQNGGIGEHLLTLLNQRGFKGDYTITAIQNQFISHAFVKDSLRKCGLDAAGMINIISKSINIQREEDICNEKG